MQTVVSIIDSPKQQTVFVCRRSQNRPCWKDVSNVNLKSPLFRQPGLGQGSSPKTVDGFFDGMATLFLVQAVVGPVEIELRGIRLQLTKGALGQPDTPITSEIKPFLLEQLTFDKNRGHSDVLSLALDHDKSRLFALYSNLGTTRLFCHDFEIKKLDAKTLKPSPKNTWLEIALPPLFQPSTLVSDGLLFSASHMASGSSSLSNRSLLDLRECKETSFAHYGPYTIEIDSQMPIEMRIMAGLGMALNDRKDLTFNPRDKMYFSESASGPVLIAGQSYTVDLSLGGRIWASDIHGKRICLPVHSGGGKTHTTVEPQLQTDRMRLGDAKNLEFSVQGSDITGLRVSASKYIVVDHVVSGTNRISAVEHGVRSNLIFLSRTDPMRDHALDLPHQFAQSGDIVSIGTVKGQVFVHTCRKGDLYNLHQLWHVLVSSDTVELTTSLTTETSAFVFFEPHPVNSFRNTTPPDVCLCTLFSDGRLSTCTCAGEFAETNRSADAFTGKKGYLRGNWDLYYMRGSPDPIAEDPRVRACVVY